MHHIASDGWSAGVLMRELSAALRVRAERTMVTAASAQVLKPLAVQYVDFARWQSQAARGPAMQESLAWWHDRLEGAPPLLALPTDRPRPPRPTFSAGARNIYHPRGVGRSFEGNRSRRASHLVHDAARRFSDYAASLHRERRHSSRRLYRRANPRRDRGADRTILEHAGDARRPDGGPDFP